VTIQEALKIAYWRSIVIGEHHGDRFCRSAILHALQVAHAHGYRRLGVEVAHGGAYCHKDKHWCSGLDEELDELRRIGVGELSEYDPHSSNDPDETGAFRRMNRYWYLQLAMQLGWHIEAIDPHHWNWMLDTPEGYYDSRDPDMAKCILARSPMIAVNGAGHLKGLYDDLGQRAVLLNTIQLNGEDERIRFMLTVPLLSM